MRKKNRIYLIEGVDGCGKQTQSEMLAAALGIEKVSFPRYGTVAAKALEAYLHGDLPLNAYGAAAAFALDRVAWVNEWRLTGAPDVVLDRYVFSNFAYQGAKFDTAEGAASFVSWAKDFEYQKLGLPKPSLMFYLTWEKEAWRKLLAERGGSKHDGKDIHESNMEYLDHVYDFGLSLARDEGAVIVRCDGKSREEIHGEILAVVKSL